MAWDGVVAFFFSSRRRHTIFDCEWSSDVCSSDLSRRRRLRREPLPRQAALSGKPLIIRGHFYQIHSMRDGLPSTAALTSHWVCAKSPRKLPAVFALPVCEASPHEERQHRNIAQQRRI